MSIESITERIRKEAQAYSDDRRAEAEAVKAEALKTAQAEADRLIQRREAEAEKDAEVLISRRQSVADLDARKMKLAAKQTVIDECYDTAVERILGLPNAEYVKFIAFPRASPSSSVSLNSETCSLLRSPPLPFLP